MSRTIRTLILVVVLGSLSAAQAATEKITVLHLNDTHGQIEPLQAKDGSKYGGYARVAFMVDSLRTEAKADGRTCLFLHGGDVLQGPIISNMNHGRFDFELLNDMELDAMVAGNHEFDFGYQNLEELIEIAQFPVLSANVADSSGNSLLIPYIEEKIGKQRVLIVGLTTRRPEICRAVGGIEISPDTALMDVLASLDYSGKDLVIALTHIGHVADSTIAERVPDVDIFVGGHSHYYTEEPMQVNDALIVQAGAQSILLGKLEAEVKKGKLIEWNYELILLTDSLPQDPDIAAKIAVEEKIVDEKFGQPIGKTEVALVPGFPEAADERSLGDILARVMKDASDADFAFTNAGGVRNQIIAGEISIKDILTAVPFQNTLVEMTLTADQVKQLLAKNIEHGENSGGTLHLAGITYEVVDSMPVNIKIDSQPVDESRSYKIITNEYIAEGGDGYEMLKEGSDIYDTGTLDYTLLVRFIEKVGVIK